MPATATAVESRAGSGHWLSKNPSKAWGERFFLIYSPIWIAGVALIQHSAAYKTWEDLGIMLWSLAMAAPLVLYPAIFRDESSLGRRWHETYWLKMNLWIWIFTWIGSYFGTEYFFDVLGMRYEFPTTWNLDAELVGRGTGEVPFALYVQTQAYFMTYHTLAVVAMRRARTSAIGRHPAVSVLVLLGLCYAIAWAETYFMANDFMSDQFRYLDRERMLKYGSIFYGCYFVVSFPMVYRLDERAEERWSLSRTAFEALAAGMLVLVLLDAWAKLIGPL